VPGLFLEFPWPLSYIQPPMFIIPCYTFLNALISSTYNFVLFYLPECVLHSLQLTFLKYFLFLFFSLFVYTAHSFTHSFIHSSVALQPFAGPWPLLQFRNLVYIAVGLLGRVTSPSQGRHRHPCLEWDSNSRSQCSCKRRKFVP
jgi:hypothetical protein